MSKTRFDFVSLRLLAALFCVTAAVPAWAGADTVSGSTITITGADNTEAVNHPDLDDLIVHLEKDAALNVKGGTAAVSLGHGGTVTLDDGAQITATQGESSVDEVRGIVLDGEEDGEQTSDNRVVMQNNSAVVVDAASGATSIAVEIANTDSAHVTMDGASLKATSKNGNARGLVMSSVTDKDTAQLVMTNGSTIEVEGNAAVSEESSSSTFGQALGVYIDESAHGVVSLTDASRIIVSEVATGMGSTAQAQGLLMSEVGEAEVGLDDHSSISSSAVSEDGMALAVGAFIEDVPSLDAKFTLSNGSKLTAEAQGNIAIAAGGVVTDSHHGNVNITSGSSITTTAVAKTQRAGEETAGALAAVSVLGMQRVDEVEIDITHADMTGVITVEAVQTGTADAYALICEQTIHGDEIIPLGVGAVGYDSATIQLTDARVTMTADATAKVKADSEGNAYAYVDVYGLLVDLEGPELKKIVSGDSKSSIVYEESHTAISLKHSSVDVTASATAADCAQAEAFGIELKNLRGEQAGDAPTLELVDSVIRVSAIATTTPEETKASAIPESPSRAQAIGIVGCDGHGNTTLNLDHTTVVAEATAITAGAFGIVADGGDGAYKLNLTNGSRIQAISHYELEENSGSAAIYLNQDATVNIDATSSVSGECSVVGCASEGGGTAPAVTVNNRGLISGFLEVETLNNFATGILQANFDDEGTFTYGATPEKDTFYFTTKTAKLDAGTTFLVVPHKSEYRPDSSGSTEYALLKATSTEPGTWRQDGLRLVGSPLLGLSWSDKSTANELVAEIQFLTPDEAGISGNAGFAFNAALADMPSDFVFGTDPEAWSPNVSGAFLTGMTQTLGASHTNIGNRLGGLMGLNSGDEIVAAGGLWYNANFTDADQGERDGVVGFDADTVGLSLGCDRQIGSLTIGVAFTQGKTEADADDNSSEMDMDDNLFSLYGSYDGGTWFGEAVLSAGVGDVESVRRLDDKIFTADYDSTSYNAIAKVGLKLSAAGFQINPLLAVDYSFKDYDSYTETGGKESGALEVDSQDYTVVNVGGGATVQRSWVNSWGVLTPEVSAMVRYDLEGDRILTTAKFVGGSTAFVAHGANPAETSWELSTALTVASIEENAVSVRLGYDYAGREDFSAHSVSGKVRFEF